MIRNLIVFLILLTVKMAARLCFRFEPEWIEAPRDDDWQDLRMITVLHHTSLFEIAYFGIVPVKVLWRLACHGLAPVASVTLERPLLGLAFKSMARNVVSLTRKRDHTWDELLSRIEERSVLILVPEGRMMRRNGLDKKGRPMTIRGGIADILEVLPPGKIFMIYSGGMHHIHIPGEDRFPRLGKTLYCRCEMLDIETYRTSLKKDVEPTREAFKATVIEDLERRRDSHCPPTGFPPQEGGPRR